MVNKKKEWNNELILLGRYSNSQNGNIYAVESISPCLCSGGDGHDATIPKIMIFDEEDCYEENEN